MLNAVVPNLDGVEESLKEHYVEKDGKFHLNVTKVDGISLENVDGLKNTVSTLRTSEKTLQQEVKTAKEATIAIQTKLDELQETYKGIDVEQAREAIGKIEDIKNWDGETKVKEAVQLAFQQTEQKMQTKIDAVVTQHTTEKETLQKDLVSSQEQLQNAIVTTKIVEAISKEGGNVDVLMPHVKSQVVMIKDSRGTWKPEVQNNDGDPRVNSDGADLSVLQLVQEMKTQDVFAGCFSGANSSGTGKQNSSESGKQNDKTNKKKVIPSSDDKAMSNNIDDIASGKTVVDMEQ